MTIAQAELARISAQYGATVPANITIKTIPRGVSSFPIPVWSKKENTLRYNDPRAEWKHQARQNWNAGRMKRVNARREFVKEAAGTGMTRNEIAERFCVSVDAIEADMKALSIPTTEIPRGNKAARDEMRANAREEDTRRLLEALTAGISINKAALSIGMSRKRAENLLRAAGMAKTKEQMANEARAREQAVLSRLAQGKTRRQIAEETGIPKSTVATIIRREAVRHA